MKILSLHIYADASIGGGAEQTRETLLAALKARGHDIFGVGTAAGGGIKCAESGGIRRWSVGLANVYWPLKDKMQPGWKKKLWHVLDVYNPVMRRRLGRILDIEKPDLVMLHNVTGWSVAAISAIAKRKIPMVQVLHDHYNLCVNSMMFRNGRNCTGQCADCRVMRLPHRVLTNQVDAVIGISQYILDRHILNGAFTKAKVKRVIHNARSADLLGLRTMQERPARAMTPLGDLNIRFGFIGTLVPSKGIEELIVAFARLNDPRAELWVAGAGKPEYETLLKRVAEDARITFMGQMKPAAFFTAIDLLVVPSLWQEPLGMVVAESFVFGVPVIGSARGGIPEMITDGQTGFIFEPDAPGALTEALRRCADVPEMLPVMAWNAQRVGTKFLDTDAWYQSYIAVINEVRAAHV